MWFNFCKIGIKEKGKVFVHCQAGISRAATAATAYFVKYHNMDVGNARQLVKKGRPITSPNSGISLCFLTASVLWQ